jgi:alcohol dehydrogenase, propanol-preferring
MKAIVAERFKEPLKIKEVPEAQLRNGFDALVRILNCGVCHTDLHAVDGDWPIKPNPPFIPGHEGVGIVERIGQWVTHLKIGDRVGIPWLHSACGSCSYCLQGEETLCEEQQNTGYTVNGGFAEYAVADSRYVAKIPAQLSSAAAAPHLCAGVTTYKAVKVSRSGPDKTVLVAGVGGLGHMAVQYAKITGARVIAVDVEEEKLALAKEVGADETINARSTDVGKAAKRLGGADIVIGTAVSANAFQSALQSLRRGGRMVLVGLPPESLPVPIFDLVLNGVSIFGSIVGTRKDLQETLDLAGRGLVTSMFEHAAMDDINDVFAHMKSGKINGRIVLDIGTAALTTLEEGELAHAGAEHSSSC